MNVYHIGAAIALFLSCILFTKSKKDKSDWILALWLLFMAIHLGYYTLAITNEIFSYPYLLGYDKLLPLLHGPFLYLYTIALTRKKSWSWKCFLHVIPIVVGFILILPFLVLDSTEKVKIYQNGGIGFIVTAKMLLAAALASGFFYTIRTLQEIFKYQRILKKNYSQVEKINLQWLLRLSIGLFLMWVIVFVASDPYIFTACVIYVILIGYYGIKQTSVFASLSSEFVTNMDQSMAQADPKNENDSISLKYEKTFLKEPQLEVIKSELEVLMQKEKMFLTPELTLTMVANRLQIHPNSLSQVINRTEQKNFFDYVNYLRIEEFKRKIADPGNSQFTIIALAYECGFNSKTAFNRNFKAFTGCSPSEYLKSVKVLVNNT